MKRPERQVRRRVISYDDITVMRIASPNNSCPIKIQTSHRIRRDVCAFTMTRYLGRMLTRVIMAIRLQAREKEEVVIYYMPSLGKTRICDNYNNALYTLCTIDKVFYFSIFFINILSSIHVSLASWNCRNIYDIYWFECELIHCFWNLFSSNETLKIYKYLEKFYT